jgi:hypothetical protein
LLALDLAKIEDIFLVASIWLRINLIFIYNIILKLNLAYNLLNN